MISLSHLGPMGCDRIGHSEIISATAKDLIGHTENQYQPQPYRPKPYRPQIIQRVYLASPCRYFDVSCTIHILNLNVKLCIRRYARKQLIRLPCYSEDECRVFLNPPIFYYLLPPHSVTSFHSYRPVSLLGLLKEYFALSSLTPFYATLIDRF